MCNTAINYPNLNIPDFYLAYLIKIDLNQNKKEIRLRSANVIRLTPINARQPHGNQNHTRLALHFLQLISFAKDYCQNQSLWTINSFVFLWIAFSEGHHLDSSTSFQIYFIWKYELRFAVINHFFHFAFTWKLNLNNGVIQRGTVHYERILMIRAGIDMLILSSSTRTASPQFLRI